jgi:hypothetical protein
MRVVGLVVLFSSWKPICIRVRIRVGSVVLRGMGSRVIPVRLDEELLELVDELVRLGLYGSRGEASGGFGAVAL